MKLRLLNGSHLAVAGLGRLMGYTTVDEAMADPLVSRYMTALMDRETGPTVPPVPGIDLAAYKTKLVERFANPAIKDTVERVNTDAPINVLLDPIRDRLQQGAPLELLALALAAWLRRVRGEDEEGRPITIKHPLADMLRQLAVEGGPDPRPLLRIEALFGAAGADPKLVDPVGKWLASLYQRGSRATLADAADQQQF
jgi:mannitol-1-phosphate/altronate dehydrogenase